MSRCQLPFYFAICIALASCNNTKELERLKSENDSLRAELMSRNELEDAMREVGSLIDSIDFNQADLRADLGEGISVENYKDRLRNINDYIASTDKRLASVEKQLRGSNKNAAAYSRMLDALRSEFSLRMEEVASLESNVSELKGELKIKETEIKELKNVVSAKEEQVTKLDAKVKEMAGTVKSTEAESYYSQAKSLEEAGNRTRLAPRKKKETYREALELYKKALSLGKQDADNDIKRLEAKLKVASSE
jgi:chromosome segregation ATPase